MATTTKPRIEPTPEQLQAEWLRVRNRRWPATLQAALQHPLYSRLLHMGVVMQQLRQQRQQRRDLATAQPLPSPAAGRWPDRRPASTAIDLKRRAAGETDDD